MWLPIVVSFDALEFRSYDNTNFHHGVEEVSSVKITYCGISKSMNAWLT